MKIPPGQRIFTTTYRYQEKTYGVLFLAKDFDDAIDQCVRIGLDAGASLGTLEGELEMTPDGPMTTWKADEEEGTVTT